MTRKYKDTDVHAINMVYDTSGTSKKGNFVCEYKVLVEALGEPLKESKFKKESTCSTSKTQVEWDIIYKDGTISTIYDYNQEGIDKEDVTCWSIGGNKTCQSVEHLKYLFITKGYGISNTGMNGDFVVHNVSRDELGKATVIHV